MVIFFILYNYTSLKIIIVGGLKLVAFLEDGNDDSKRGEDENHNLSFDSDTVPEWMIELPEDLDVCIAQRDFEEATNLIERATEFINNHSYIQQVKDMR